jgi:precorrin-6B methylase 2
MNRLKRILDKLVRAGDTGRRSRFHTLRGDRAPLSAWVDFPACLTQMLVFKAFGHRPALPWIPYAAIRFLRRRITPAWRVLEIGAGMSTLWLARHCGQVDSIEADQRWVDLLRADIARHGVTNARVLFRWRADEMCDFRDWPDGSLDLAFVDGGPRPQCLEAALPKVKPGGFVYVDNTDSVKTAQNSRELLEAYAREHRCPMWIFRGFVPCNLFVNEGMLLEKNSAAA